MNSGTNLMTTEASTKTIEKIGRYRVTGELGRGGMGVVYKGEDRQIGRRVAIKTLTDATPELRERFYIEARSGILSHQNIVTVYEVGEHEGRPFIAMEFVEGDSLEKVLRTRKRLDVLEALSIVEQICSGLGHAHGHGVVHRDVKPANILVRPDGRVTIVDFGIARLADQTRQLTKTDTLLGTFHYIAPERLKGETSDGRADIWSTGVMLYEMVTGALPFKGSDISSVYRVIHEPYVPVAEHVRDLPFGLSRILDKALAKQVDERYATAEEMAFDVRRLAGELKGEEAVARRDDSHTVIQQAKRIDQRKTQRGAESEETQQVPQTIPYSLVKEGQATLAPAVDEGEGTRRVELAPRKPAEEEAQDVPPDQSSARPHRSQSVNASSPQQGLLAVDRPKEDGADLKSEHRRTAEVLNAVEKAVAACDEAIAKHELDSCMRPFEDLAKRHGKSPMLAAAREVCRSRRAKIATDVLWDAIRTSRTYLRNSQVNHAQKALKEVEYALPFADPDASSEWQRLKGEYAAAPKAKPPGVAGVKSARHRKSRWFAVVCAIVIAALAVAAVSYHRPKVAAAPQKEALPAPTPAEVPADVEAPTDMEINASPWATVISVEGESGERVLLPEGEQTTPLRLGGLKRGKYKVTLGDAHGNQQTMDCDVSLDEHLCSFNLGSPDLDQVLAGGQP
jgi:serine/threonine protein kinase